MYFGTKVVLSSRITVVKTFLLLGGCVGVAVPKQKQSGATRRPPRRFVIVIGIGIGIGSGSCDWLKQRKSWF